MSPCVFCHRRSVAESEFGPLCSACAQDNEEDMRESFSLDEFEPTRNICRFPDPCNCEECEAVNSVVWSDEDGKDEV